MRAALLLAALVACEPETSGVPSDTAAPLVDIDPGPWDVPPPAWLANAASAADNTPADNPITDAGATLGRALFWDPELSVDGTVACASCHLPEAGFADVMAGSTGVDGVTGRKSMPLVNLRYYRSGRMFWDERAETLEDQVLMPIQDPVEMGATLDEAVARVEGNPLYPPLFEAAFGDPAVDADRLARALAQFVRAMTTFDSRWDQGMAATGDPLAPFPGFTAEENRGKDIFFGRHEPGGRPLCNACHLPGGGPPGGPAGTPDPGLFFMPGPRVNGLPDASDLGVAERTGLVADRGRFKSPSLRNVELRAPYMHDGRFATLAEVVDFYDHGVQDAPNLDPALRGPDGPRRLGLSPEDRAALVAFLRALTDEGPAFDERFQDPFGP